MTISPAVSEILSTNNIARCKTLLSNAFLQLKRHDGVAKIKQAAVLVPFCTYQNIPSVLFVRRPLWMRKHAGEIAFPGGGVEPEDNSLANTAIREANEELGISLPSSSVIGCLPQSLPNKDGSFIVSAVVAVIGSVGSHNDHDLLESSQPRHILRPHTGEVDDVYIVSVEKLLKTKRHCRVRLGSNNKRLRFWDGPCYPVRSDINGHQEFIQIWGLTGYLLQEVLKIFNPVNE